MKQARKDGRRLGRIWGRAGWVVLLAVIVTVGVVTAWFKQDKATGKGRHTAPIPVTLVTVTTADLPRMIEAKGNVVPLQSVDIKPQVAANVKRVAFAEGQNVRRGEPLYELDMEQAKANLARAEAQALKSSTDLANFQRTLKRQRELFERRFISQAQVDTAQNQADSAQAQLAADAAAVHSARVAAGFGDIRAPISGRAGANTVYPGSLVQPAGAALVTITQIDPIAVAFSIPERDLAAVQEALKAARSDVEIRDGSSSKVVASGRLSFIDNAVDSTSGTVRVKAEVANAGAALWPGMYVTVRLIPFVYKAASVVPVAALQIGVQATTVYSVGKDMTVKAQIVKLLHVHEGLAAVEGLEPGTRIVAEGVQNLRKGSTVVEAVAVREGASPAEVKQP